MIKTKIPGGVRRRGKQQPRVELALPVGLLDSGAVEKDGSGALSGLLWDTGSGQQLLGPTQQDLEDQLQPPLSKGRKLEAV